ncbi:MAG: metalloregulator ArsR/SmtB family transcription factor [Rubrivivax sp.]
MQPRLPLPDAADEAVAAPDPSSADDAAAQDHVFSSAAELFRLLSTPIRLKIISALCQTEKNVTQLLHEIDTTQPNMSQHLSTLYRAGVLGRRRDATQIYYRIGNERAASLCRAVCTQIALEMNPQEDVPSTERLTPQAGSR